MQDYKQLEVWDRGHKITLKLYPLTATFPKEERFGMVSQIRRCSASIGANIAEGCGRNSEGDLQRFLEIAAGSASELDYHLLLARDLGFLSRHDYDGLVPELATLRRKLTAFINRVSECRPTKNQKPKTKNNFAKC
ncbi:MAG: four helix bundle protein [Terriglobales bacterium]